MPENTNSESRINIQSNSPERLSQSPEIQNISEQSLTENTSVNLEISQIRNQFDIPLVIKNEYYLNKEKKILKINGGGFIEPNKTRYETYGPNYHDSLSDRIANRACILKLKLSGVKNPVEYYQTFHERGFNNQTISKKEVVDNFRDMPPSEIATGIDRINKLGFDLSFVSELSEEKVAQEIKRISSIDDDRFNKVTSELNQYYFLKNKNFRCEDNFFSSIGKYTSGDGINPAYKAIVENIENGQIDPIIKNRLELIKEISSVDYFYDEKDHSDSFVEVKKDGFGQTPRLEDFFDPNKEFKFSFTANVDYDMFDNNFNYICQNISSFDSNSRFNIYDSLDWKQTEKLSDRNGKFSFFREINDDISDYRMKNIINFVINHNDSITHNYADDSQKSDFLFDLLSVPTENDIQELAKSDFIDLIAPNLNSKIIKSLPDQNDQKFWSLVKDLKSYRFIKPLLDTDQGYLDIDQNPTEKFFEKLALLGEHHVISNYGYLHNFSQASQEFWIRFSDHPNEILTEIIEIKNSLKKPNFDNETKSDFYDQISDRLATVASKILNKNNDLKGIYTFVDESVIENFKSEDQRFWRFMRDDKYTKSKNIQKMLVSNKEKFSTFFDQNDNPTISFFEACFTAKIYPEIPKNILESLSPKDRNFLSAMAATKNNRLISTLIDNRSAYEAGKTDFFYHNINEEYFGRKGVTFGEILKIIYADEDKRLSSVVGLCGWRVYSDYLSSNNIDSQNLTLQDFRQIIDVSKQEIDKKLHYIKNTELNIPKGMRVSIGTEIEVILNGITRTGKVSKEEINDYIRLGEKLNQRPNLFAEEFVEEIQEKIVDASSMYRNQVEYIDEMGVGKGNDALHEFANNATKNYSVLVWELYEISRLGFLDFDRKFLQNIERGMHLTISGDQEGIRLDQNAHLLQNAMLSSGWSTDALDAVGATEVVDTVDNSSEKLYSQIKGYILQRDRLKENIFEEQSLEHTKGVENRALRIDSFNNLSRTIENFYHLAIPLKTYQSFVKDYGSKTEDKLLSEINSKLDQKYTLSKLIEESSNLLPEVEDEKVQKTIIAWAYFRESTVRNFADKQKNLGKYKLKNPLSEYNNRDMTKLGAELLEVFGGITDEGEKTEDALKKYGERAEAGSLPNAERKLILEVKKEVRKIFKTKK